MICLICSTREAFAKLRIEIPAGAATHFVCLDATCLEETARRARDNLLSAAAKANEAQAPYPDAVDVEAREVGMLDEGDAGARTIPADR